MGWAACVYMAAMGKHGMQKVAELCWHKAHYAADEIDKLENYSVKREETFFKEFVVNCPKPVAEINKTLMKRGIIGGYDLGRDFEGCENEMLVCVTEMNTKREIDSLVKALKEAGKGETSA